MRGCKGAKKTFVSAKNRKARYLWAKNRLHWTLKEWSIVLWSNEKKFKRLGSDYIVWVRRRPSELFHPESLRGTIKGCGSSIMALTCFSATGLGVLLIRKSKLLLQQTLMNYKKCLKWHGALFLKNSVKK